MAADWYSRGWHRYRLLDHIGAIADYDAALAIGDGAREALRDRGNEAAWDLPLRNDLAEVL
jgi:hypothetical protein